MTQLFAFWMGGCVGFLFGFFAFALLKMLKDEPEHYK